ncbi:hypothetical protein ELI02_34010 [Rhizobium leguminosarum]|uniref:hypothetical protein n=1 Tax=Rhizobium leguminosarum TaxID=384 RepID=UPI00102FA8E5|nr:hypothetical protein [Rhizobium leguminosarum]TAX22764.1 hypothetical protein ELI04_32720 [Rhizobium leguminosarum]TAX43407.1 hypothetical protein ELI02_34010 [Rhizobium leguminosarum]
MASVQIDETPGLQSRADAEAWAEIFQRDGWQTEIIPEEGGTFLLRATKATNPAMNAGGDTPEMPAGTVTIPFQGNLKNLLDFIGLYEAAGNYNAYYGHPQNQNNPKFTGMLLDSVLAWQRNYTEVNGSPSSAVGKYQIIRSTLDRLIDRLTLQGSDTRFTTEIQDSMAIKLLEARGLLRFRSNQISVEAFGNEVAKEWAAMPVLTAIVGSKGINLQRGQSYYSGDGLNKARASSDEFTAALLAVKQ